MPKTWGQAVHGLWSICAQVPELSIALVSDKNEGAQTHSLFPTLSKFCTQFTHTKNRLFTPVNGMFCTSSTAPIITITIYI